MSKSQHGFTLLEMAIVVTIVSMLIGGVLYGSAVVRNSRLQSMTADVERYQQAIADFRDKYGSLPGDMSNATSYWGTAADCNAYVTSWTAATCNGDGNEKIESNNEMRRVWQQLYNAQFVNIAYTGAQGPAGANDFTMGLNSPDTGVHGIFLLQYVDAPTGNANYFPITRKHELYVTATNDGSSKPNIGVLTGKEAMGIDSKIDDGMPGMGKMQAQKAVGVCASTVVADTARYVDTSDTTAICAPKFIMGF
jgi:prepilin-type N-terminal cleavage/methylation domain-containing protein